MGMFDYIVCDYPLPDCPAFVKKGHQFQTKDTDPQWLETHTIAEDGSFSIDGYTGTVEFYTSNIVGSGPGIYTRNGEDAESVTYLAAFDNGRVKTIERIAYDCEPGMVSDHEPYRPTDEDVARWRAREAESLVGRRIYVLYGGQTEGYWGEVIAEGIKQLCIRNDEGELELLHRSSRDTTHFDSVEDATASRQRRTTDWETRKARYDKYAEEWRKQKGAK